MRLEKWEWCCLSCVLLLGCGFLWLLVWGWM